MQPLRQLEGPAAVLRLDNVDTDQILPARYLKTPRAQGYGEYLFRDLRVATDGTVREDFPVKPGAAVLIARRAFGVGSSREAAVYALVDFGIRCVVATSFGDIFAGNAVSNGLLTAVVNEERIEELSHAAETTGHARIDLEACTIASGGLTLPFWIEPVRRIKLLNGWDDLDLTRTYAEAIANFAKRDDSARPWAKPMRQAQP
jgi:3-isopropylmalate/(R)-2-methylmalate dehydratase small subunit